VEGKGGVWVRAEGEAEVGAKAALVTTGCLLTRGVDLSCDVQRWKSCES
jgi:hypothetical protein